MPVENFEKNDMSYSRLLYKPFIRLFNSTMSHECIFLQMVNDIKESDRSIECSIISLPSNFSMVSIMKVHIQNFECSIFYSNKYTNEISDQLILRGQYNITKIKRDLRFLYRIQINKEVQYEL